MRMLFTMGKICWTSKWSGKSHSRKELLNEWTVCEWMYEFFWIFSRFTFTSIFPLVYWAGVECFHSGSQLRGDFAIRRAPGSQVPWLGFSAPHTRRLIPWVPRKCMTDVGSLALSSPADTCAGGWGLILRVYVSCSLLIKTIAKDLGPTSPHCNLTLTEYICKDFCGLGECEFWGGHYSIYYNMTYSFLFLNFNLSISL